MEKTT